MEEKGKEQEGDPESSRKSDFSFVTYNDTFSPAREVRTVIGSRSETSGHPANLRLPAGRFYQLKRTPKEQGRTEDPSNQITAV